MKDFTIDRVSWYTNRDPDPAFQAKIRERIRALAQFLDAHNLTVMPLLGEAGAITDDFGIMASNLTEEGLSLMKKAHDKWLRSFDRNPEKSPSDVSLLDRELKKLRSE